MKRINGSVGNGAKNAARDVMTIQYLLNCVPKFKGGPDQELAVDGLCGPKTCGAISKFQKQQTGFTDGRVDPNGKTFAALNNFDPYPAHDPFAGMSTGAGAGGGGSKNGKQSAASGGGGTEVGSVKQVSGKQSGKTGQTGPGWLPGNQKTGGGGLVGG